METTTGKLIVVEGTDGSGKATQSKLLIRRLKKEGHAVKLLDFPQYGKPSCGAVEKYLNGKYGSSRDVGPYRASIFYAVDRFDASFKLKKWLIQGNIVIANRYVASNLAHQGGSIASPEKRKKYIEWDNNLEYNIFQIPKPDANIILFVPAEISQQLVDHKGFRKYLKGKKRDILEADIQHLKNAENAYQKLAQLFPQNYTLIPCSENNTIMSRKKISDLVWNEIKKIL